MSEGYLALVLHTHLPFVKHPEHERPLEERWLHEALFECYLPLLDVFDRLAREGIPFALTMSLTPPLAAMLEDDLLRARFEEHLDRLITLCAHEVERTDGDPYFNPIARFYQHRLDRARATWLACGGRVVQALAAHHATGQLELITCSATHAYLPGLLPCPGALRAQLRLGAAAFHHLVGHRPLGIWLPECAYDPSFDDEISASGLRFTIVDAHGLRHARPRPPFDIHHPVVSPSGVAFFARDQHSSEQVWSREGGYPGNPYYRDFYRDIGYDLPVEQLHGEVGPFNTRVMTGLKYHRITGKTDKKLPYMPGVAAECARRDALDFLQNRTGHAYHLAPTMPVPPVIVAPYDSELFGHWWFEGPQFLEWIFRHAHAHHPHAIRPITLRGYLDRFPTALQATPAASSWGAGGHGEVWVGPAAARFWRHVHHASHRVEHLVRRHQDAAGPRGEALDLAIRELLLLQTSDWPFILSTATTVEYAEARLRSHAARVRRLCAMIEAESVSEADVRWMRELDQRDSFLSGLSSRVLRGAFLEERPAR
jgi:1,4-alpha-glucan branching enzyme